MKNSLKYPIKYVIVPMEEQTRCGYGLQELEKEYEIVFNIVSKCYVISEKFEYKHDGSCAKTFEVVFPFERSEYEMRLKRCIPKYNFYGECTNSICADELFSDFEEAISKASEKNDMLLKRKLRYMLTSKFESIKNEYYEITKKYKDFEKKVSEDTTDMEISGIIHSEESDIREIVLIKK